MAGSSVHRSLACAWLVLACPGLVMPGPLWGLGEIALLAQSAVNSSNFWACLGVPPETFGFLYTISFFCFCDLTRLHAAYAAARRTQAASQYRRAVILFGEGKG